jgi:ATP-dependent Clp protease ATP-binding subunit ClpA
MEAAFLAALGCIHRGAFLAAGPVASPCVIGGWTMFEKFTERARKVMAIARLEAQRLNSEFIGSEHILLGILQEGGGIAAKVLKDLKLDIKIIRLETEKLIIPSSSPTMTLGQLPFSPRAKRVIELAGNACEMLHNNRIGTENLLMGCMMEKESISYQVLNNLGIDIDSICARIKVLIGNSVLEEKNALIRTKDSPLSDAEICQQNKWTPGTLLEGIENGVRTVIQITALGFEAILARVISRNGDPKNEKETSWTLKTRDWSRI